MEKVCPEIHYRKLCDGIMITSCYGDNGSVFLPDEIEGVPVIAIAPYAFAKSEENTEDYIWKSEELLDRSERRRLMADDLLEIRLPKRIKEIGRYAFYRCRNLEKMTLSDEIMEIGGGALNGCRLKEVEIHFHNGERSALKSILDEIRFAIHARLYYDREDSIVEIADILFPEHYEEAVENTPARILYTSHHGAGGYYRQCFFDRKLDYKKYDETFSRALAEESEDTVIKLSMGRLLYPFQLSFQAKEVYENYIKEHFNKAVYFYINAEDWEALRFFTNQGYWTKESLEEGIDCAARLGKTEILSTLMDEKHKFFPKKKKTFDL
ncbi:MAG: leucine-rich repeat protein [Lachnospiraceae bacterium]